MRPRCPCCSRRCRWGLAGPSSWSPIPRHLTFCGNRRATLGTGRDPRPGARRDARRSATSGRSPLRCAATSTVTSCASPMAKFVLGQRLELAMEQLTWLAESLVAAALQAAQRQAGHQRPLPERIDPARLACCVIAFGRLGGGEMDYASRAELLVAYDAAPSDANEQSARFVNISSASPGTWCDCSRVRMNPRSLFRSFGHAARTPAAASATPRTMSRWDSKALAARGTARRCCGPGRRRRSGPRPVPLGPPRGLAVSPLPQRADETGIRAWKRRIQATARLAQDEWRSASQARGGLRDLEATVQFLQLLFGGDRPEVRQRAAFCRRSPGWSGPACWPPKSECALEESYSGPPPPGASPAASQQPANGGRAADGRTRSARRYAVLQRLSHAGRVLRQVAATFRPTWQILDRLLTSAFAEEPPSPREVELLLDPDPPEEEIGAALAPFGFARPRAALATLQQLAQSRFRSFPRAAAGICWPRSCRNCSVR